MSTLAELTGRVRIVSDGTLRGTRVTTADTGAEIACTHVSIELDGQKIAKAELTCVACHVDVDADVQFKCGLKER